VYGFTLHADIFLYEPGSVVVLYPAFGKVGAAYIDSDVRDTGASGFLRGHRTVHRFALHANIPLMTVKLS
jgi:hypothetical protein